MAVKGKVLISKVDDGGSVLQEGFDDVGIVADDGLDGAEGQVGAEQSGCE